MADGFPGSPTNRSMGLGLRVPGAPLSGDPSTRMGLGGLQTTKADDLVGLGGYVPGQFAMESAERLRAPKAAPAYFNQATNEMFAGDRAFKADDVQSALEASQAPTTTAPQGEGWVPLPESSYRNYLSAFSERRGTMELLGRGVKNVAYGLGTLPGTLTSLAGFEETGAALRAPVESLLGDSENERLRSSLIAENSTLWEQIKDASIESIPFLLTSFAGGAGGAALAGRGAGLTAEAALAAKTAGALRGATYVNLPTHLASMYDAAVQNGQDLSSLDTKAFILGGALANTAIERFGIEGRLFSPAVKDAVAKSATRAVRDRLLSGSLVGLQEAGTEVFQTAMETLLFDPEVRDRMTPQDWKTILPYALETYGESYLIAAGAGALLGGGVGTILPPGAAAPRTKAPVDTSKPLDLNQTATGQSAEGEVNPNLYGQQSFQPLALPYIPGAPTIGARPMAGESMDLPERASGPNVRPLTLQQVGLMRGATGGLRPEDRQTGNIIAPSDGRVRNGEVLDPLRRGLPPPPVTGALPPPGVSEADFTAGPQGVVPAGMSIVEPETEAAPVRTAAERLRVGMAPRAQLLAASPAPNNVIAEKLSAAIAARQATKDQQAADRLAIAEENRRAQLAEAVRAAQIEEAFAQRDVQRGSLAENQVRAAEEEVATARTAWEKFRNRRAATLVPRAQRTVAKSVEFDTLAPKAQQTWLKAVRKGTATEALYKRLRNAAAAAAPAAPAAEPVVTPAPAAPTLPAGVFGTKDGKPFKNKPAANGAKSSVAKREGVAAATLTVVEVPGGFGLRVTSPAAPVTQGTNGTTGTQEGRVRKGRAAAPEGTKSEAAPEPEPEPEVQAPSRTPTETTGAKTQTGEAAAQRQGIIDAAMDEVSAGTATVRKEPEVDLPTEAKNNAQLAVDAGMQKEEAALFGWLAAAIDRFNAGTLADTQQFRSQFRQKMETLRAKKSKAQYGGAPLTDFAQLDHNPNVSSVNGTPQIVSKDRTGRNSIADYNTIDGLVDLSGKPAVPLPAGRVEMFVRNYAKKLKRPPTFTVARNQADLKAKNPALYRRAKAARSQGDFDTANALGYSFGDGQVIIFTDRLGSEQQLEFVLAHETLGHYGLRAIMPADKFSATMEQVYKSDPLVAAIVDRAVEARGMSRAEAVEEYLADYAAVLDMSLLRRVAAAMKTALNAIGFKFSDDMVRHLLRMSRRYVRNGKRDSLFATSDIFRDIQAIESGTDQLETGRFKEGFTRDNIRTDMVSLDVFGHMPRNVEDVTAALRPSAERLSSGTEAAIRKFFSLTAFSALDNAGLSRLMNIIQRGSEISTKIRNAADEIMGSALDREVTFFGVRIMKGITELEQLAASRLNYGQQDEVRGKVDARLAATLKQLEKDKRTTRMFNIVGGLPKENKDTIAAYIKAGRLELADAKKLLAKDPRYKKIADELTTDHEAWKAYENTREAFEMAEIEFVKAQYQALTDDRANAELALLDLLPDPGPGKDKVMPTYAPAMFKTWTDMYFALYSAGATTYEDNLVAAEPSAKRAEEFNAAVNEAIIAKGFDTTKEDAIRKFLKGQAADDFIAQVVKFRSQVVVTADNKFLVQQKVSEFGAAELSFTSAEISSRKMLVQGYTPINRTEEGFQIRTQAYDPETNEMLQMENEYRDRAVYRMVGTADEATRLAAAMQREVSSTDLPADAPGDIVIKTIKDKDGRDVKVRAYKVMTRKAGESEFKMREVVLRFESSAAATGVSTPLSLNLNEFLRGLRQYGLNVHPSKLEQIVVDMTAQDSKARKRLEQTGNPGYEVQGGVTALEAIARHIDTRASLIAKIQMRPKLDRLMNVKLSESRKLWFGDQEKLDGLKKAYDDAVSSGADESTVFLAKKEYDRLKYQMGKTIETVNGVPVNMGNKYLSEGHSLLTFVNGNRDVNESDWGSGPVASFVRRWVSAVQLGGSLAQPIMNNVGPFTNFIPWLGSFNAKNGYGGGAGIKNAYAQYLRALSDVGGGAGVSFTKRAMEMHTADYWNQVATGLVVHPGVSTAEAEFIASETLNGILTPAQANSLLGHSRNYTTNPAIRKALDKWMFFYLSSEQSTRRSAALAAFRVEFERQAARKGLTAEQLSKPENKAEYKKIHAAATEFAAEGVRLSLGEYGVTNRPAAWRSGLQSFLYMYRVWPTTSIQSLKRMDAWGRAAMLVPLLALSGLAGLPFAEDGEDFLDTILQRLGLPIGSVRLEAARLIDEVLPGASPYILNGGLSALIGADVAGRFGMGDFIPGSAGLLPGQELSQTIRDVLGPAWGFIEGVGKGGSELVAAPFSDTATFVGAMRDGPVTLFRALGDVAAYTSAGAVVDKRGYVVDPDLTLHTLVTRTLGFTPASVAAQYEVIRLAKRETNYQKQVVAKFRTALLKAEMSGDRVTAASIRRTVAEWNEITDGTLLEIRNFEKNYRRVYKQANMTVTQRLLQSVGKNNRDAIELLDDLTSYD